MTSPCGERVRIRSHLEAFGPAAVDRLGEVIHNLGIIDTRWPLARRLREGHHVRDGHIRALGYCLIRAGHAVGNLCLGFGGVHSRPFSDGWALLARPMSAT